MTALPSWLIEISNGTLFLLVLMMVVFALLYLWKQWREHGSFRRVYAESTAAIALCCTLIGIDTGIFVRWWFRHMQNHGINPSPYVDVGMFMVVAGTGIAIWGGICWIKVITPLRFPRGTWFLVAAAAIAIAGVMAF